MSHRLLQLVFKKKALRDVEEALVRKNKPYFRSYQTVIFTRKLLNNLGTLCC